MLRFFTDPHLGRNPTSHTTIGSRKMMNTALYVYGKNALSNDYPNICLGDLFHTAHNSEEVIAQGAEIALACDLVLEGNHDLPNRSNSISSIGLIQHQQINKHAPTFASCAVGSTRVIEKTIDGVKIVAIPHHSSQELFDKAIEMACQIGGELCVMHCNYDSPFVDGIDTSLNLSEAQAEELAKHFDYIVLGHEHNFRWELNKKVLILGNTHPTSFSDLSDKYCWDYDPSDKSWHKHMLWRKEIHYKKVYLEDLLNDDVYFDSAIQFVDIVGRYATSEESFLLSKKIQWIWETFPHLLMVRNHTSRIENEANDQFDSNENITPNLKDAIHQLVKGTHMEETYLSYVEGIDHD